MPGFAIANSNPPLYSPRMNLPRASKRFKQVTSVVRRMQICPMTSCLAAVALWLLSGTAFAFQLPSLSLIGEPASFKDDAQAQKADLGYRISIRPCFSSPVAMKLYVTCTLSKINEGWTNEGFALSGRFVVKGIDDEKSGKVRHLETQLSHKQVVAILSVIRDQDVFNLGSGEMCGSPEGNIIGSISPMDPTVWRFERLQTTEYSRPLANPRYTIVVRSANSKHGPASEVFSAFSKYGLRLLNNRQQPAQTSLPTKGH